VGIKYSGDEADTNSKVFLSTRKTVDATGIVASVSSSAAEDRQFVRITNKGDNEVFYGPVGSVVNDMDSIEPHNWIEVALTSDIEVFLRCNTGETSEVIIQEIG
jgi:hypothetical protein